MSANGGADRLVARLEVLPFSRWHWHFAIVAAFAVLFDATDFAIFGATLPAIAHEFHFGPAQAGLLAMIGLVGASVGAFTGGTISDYIGRRTTFIVADIVFSIFTAAAAFSWSVPSLTVFRFLANLGLGAMVPVSITIVSEFMPSEIRGRVTTWTQTAFPVGLALAAGLSLLMIGPLGWRSVFLVGFLPIILVFFALRYFPESVRYLVAKGRIAEAEKIVSQIEREALRGGEAPVAKAPVLHADVVKNSRLTFSELLAPAYRRRTMLLWLVSFCFFWSANGLLFMLPTILVENGYALNRAISFALVQALFGFFGYFSCGYLIDQFGRRPVLFWYYVIGAAFHLWFAEATGAWMYAAISGVGWVNPGVFGPTSIYASELYPTHMRATAVGWFYGIGRIGSFLAPAVVGIMFIYKLNAFVLPSFALTYLIAGIAVFMIGIETRGRILEQIGTVSVPSE